MGFGPDEDFTGGPDHDDGAGAIVYRFAISSVDGGHNPSPAISRAQWTAMLDAATSDSALNGHIQQNHSALWAWWSALSAGRRGKLRTAALAVRGL